MNKLSNLSNRRLVDMTGEELISLLREAKEEVSIINNNVCEHMGPVGVPRVLLRGYKELSSFLRCSVPTACRMVTRGDIHSPAIIRSGKTLLFDSELVLQQLTDVNSRWQPKYSGKNGIAINMR